MADMFISLQSRKFNSLKWEAFWKYRTSFSWLQILSLLMRSTNDPVWSYWKEIVHRVSNSTASTEDRLKNNWPIIVLQNSAVLVHVMWSLLSDFFVACRTEKELYYWFIFLFPSFWFTFGHKRWKHNGRTTRSVRFITTRFRLCFRPHVPGSHSNRACSAAPLLFPSLEWTRLRDL